MVTSAPKTFSMLAAGSTTSMRPFAPMAPTLTSALQEGPAGKRAGSIPTIVSRTRSGSCKRASPVAGGKPLMLGSSPATRARAALKVACALVAGASTRLGIRPLVTITATAMVLRKNRDVIIYAPFPQAMLPGIAMRTDVTHDVRHVVTGEKIGGMPSGIAALEAFTTLPNGRCVED